MTTYLLRLMGAPRLFYDTGQQQAAFDLAPASLSLLALLGLPRHSGGVARTRLAELVSPDCDPDRSASRLSSALHRLKAALGHHAKHVLRFSTGHQTVELTQQVMVDVDRVAQTSATLSARQSNQNIAALEDAVSARAGAFLDGVTSPWAEPARQEISDIYECALEQLVTSYRDAGAVDHSISAARTLIRDDPYREDIHAVLLELYGRKGMRKHAASHFQKARTLLEQDLGVAPSEDMKCGLRSALSQQSDASQRTRPDTDAIFNKLAEIDAMIRTLAGKVDHLIDTKGDRKTAEILRIK